MFYDTGGAGVSILVISGVLRRQSARVWGPGSSGIGSASGGIMKHSNDGARLINQNALLMPKTPLLPLDSFLVRRGPM